MKQEMKAITGLIELNELLAAANKGEIIINSFIPNITLENAVGEDIGVLIISIEKENVDE